MPEIVSRDDVLAPQKTITFSYKGDNAYNAMNQANAIIADAYGIPGKNQFELEFKYDNSDPTSASFHGVWRGEGGKDSYSTVVVIIKAKGSQNKQTGEGHATIWITPYVVTTYSYSNFITKGLWKLWSLMFYNKKRRQYIERARQQTEKAKSLLTKRFGVNLKMRG